MVYYEEGLEVVPNGDDAPCVKSVEDPDPKTGHQYPCETADKYLAVNTNEPKTSFHEDNLEQQKGTKDTEDFTRRRRRICGLPRMWFWILLGVCGLIVIGAALGAGVGVGLMKSESSESEDSVTSPSSTTSSPTNSRKVAIASSTTSTSTLPTGTDIAQCPDSNGTTYTPSGTTSSFTKHCNTDYYNPTDGYSINIGATVNVASIDACIDQCVSYNTQTSAVVGEGGCVAVALDMSMQNATALGECWLKNSTGRVITTDRSEQDTAAACLAGFC